MNLDCESVDVYSNKMHTARKEVSCSACCENILVGQRYFREAALFDGEWIVTKRCLRCERIYQHLCLLAKASEGGWPDSSLRCGHSYEEVHGEAAPAEIAALAFALPSDFMEVQHAGAT